MIAIMPQIKPDRNILQNLNKLLYLTTSYFINRIHGPMVFPSGRFIFLRVMFLAILLCVCQLFVSVVPIVFAVVFLYPLKVSLSVGPHILAPRTHFPCHSYSELTLNLESRSPIA